MYVNVFRQSIQWFQHITLTIFYIKHPQTTYNYTLSLHDALPIFTIGELVAKAKAGTPDHDVRTTWNLLGDPTLKLDRKSTRLNSSHSQISYAVFCLKKKKDNIVTHSRLTT